MDIKDKIYSNAVIVGIKKHFNRIYWCDIG